METASAVSDMLLYSIIESADHPKLTELYRSRNIREVRLTSMRKAIQALSEQRPDYVVAGFFYGYGNNYAGANLGNLDVFLASLQKYAPWARVIVMVDKVCSRNQTTARDSARTVIGSPPLISNTSPVGDSSRRRDKRATSAFDSFSSSSAAPVSGTS